MQYYTIAKKTNQIYGHGSCGYEFHICPIDAYTNQGSQDFPPLFKSKEEAEAYLEDKEVYEGIVVTMEVS